jgi:acetaldehyde dehydrogenase (acetylating)
MVVRVGPNVAWLRNRAASASLNTNIAGFDSGSGAGVESVGGAATGAGLVSAAGAEEPPPPPQATSNKTKIADTNDLIK